MKEQINVGIVGVGVYLPSVTMSAKEISQATNGVWSEQAVIEKLGIVKKYLPNVDDGTQEMGARAALNCLENTKVNPLDIDVILCIGEEWKEFPLTTSACYIQDRIGAKNAWGIDLQNRCCTCVSAMKIAADMLRADERQFLANVVKASYERTDRSINNNVINGLGIKFDIIRHLNPMHYAATSVDVMHPAASSAFCAMQYADGSSAAVAYDGSDYKCFVMGFPFECINNMNARRQVMKAVMDFLVKR